MANQRLDRAGRGNRGSGVVRGYVAAIAAAAMLGGMSGQAGWAQEGGQAVTPPDARGGTPAAPAGAVPGMAPAPVTPAATPSQIPATPPNPANNPPAVAAPTPAPATVNPATGQPVQPATPTAAGTTVTPPVSQGAVDAGGQAVVPANVGSTGVTTSPAAVPSAPETPTAATPAPSSGGPGAAATPAPVVSTARAATGPAGIYPVTSIKVDYLKPQPQQPLISELLNTSIQIGVKDGAYVAPGEKDARVTEVRLGDIGKGEIGKVSRSGIETIYGQIVKFYNKKGIIGVFVVVDSKDINQFDKDIRPADRTTLQFIVVTSSVKEVRTVLTGDKIPEAGRVDDPAHRAIRDKSPLQPGGSNLLNKDALDEYVMRLNRQPGRRLDVALSGTGDLGAVTLDYLIAENRPWYAYAQVSNTGTKQTNEWRERFGGVDNQLTGHDDILTVDYQTAGFTSSHAVLASYELPFFSFDRMRVKGYASYNEFTASDVGENSEQFSGNQWIAGAELSYNVFQHRELFVDLVGGLRGQGVETDNVTAQLTGQATYLVPYGGIRLQRNTEIASTVGQVTVMGYITGANETDIEALGRAQPTQNPVVVSWDFAQTAYLEPLLDPNGFVAGRSTLAHELYFGAHGQYSPNRLFPQAQDVAGGFYTVRGYPESIAAGDSVITATAEYRFHFPRILPVQPDPGKTPFLWDKRFKFSPSQVYGRPDWDLIARAFFDVAQVWNTNKLDFEEDHTLAGTGVGIELQYKQNLNIRVDWGFALIGIDNEVNAGDNRVHVSATLLY